MTRPSTSSGLRLTRGTSPRPPVSVVYTERAQRVEVCLGPGSNRRPLPLQGNALPTELPKQGRTLYTIYQNEAFGTP